MDFTLYFTINTGIFQLRPFFRVLCLINSCYTRYVSWLYTISNISNRSNICNISNIVQHILSSDHTLRVSLWHISCAEFLPPRSNWSAKSGWGKQRWQPRQTYKLQTVSWSQNCVQFFFQTNGSRNFGARLVPVCRAQDPDLHGGDAF